MKKPFVLKEAYVSYVFWTFFLIALVFYFAIYKINSKLSDINYLLSQKNQLEGVISQNSLEIITLKKFAKDYSDIRSIDLSQEVFTKKLEKLLQQYGFSDDCMAVQQNDSETIYTIEDTTDYFLLQSFLLDLCKLRANATNISLRAEGEHVHFVITILG